MTVEELETLYRLALDDTRGEFLFPHNEFLLYLNEAVEEAAIRKDLLFDNSSAFCSIAVVAGTAAYKLNCAFYVLTYATVDNGEHNLAIVDRYELDRIYPNWRSLQGEPKYLIHYDNNVLTLAPTPDQAYTLKVEGYRLPLKKLGSNGDCPEIHKKHHKDLVNWCCYRALNRPDVDTFQPNKALEYLDRFEKVFGHSVDADNKRDWHANVPHHVKAVI